MSKLFVCLVLSACLYQGSYAQSITTPAPSSHQTIKQELGLSSVELTYSRPDMKGRKIFGDLVPYGKVWRTGANQATTLTFGDPVTIGGTKIPAGKYGLLSIPGADEWTIIVTKQLEVTNPAAYKSDQDVVRVQAKPVPLSFSVESFSILFANVTASTCDLQLIWENTLVTFPIQTDIDTKVMAQIDNAMSKDNHPYFQAAIYYLDNGKDLNKALDWFDKAIAQDPTPGGSFFIVYQKARCLAKMGRKADAKTTAQKGIDLAKQVNNADYVALNEKLIASL
jgi:hypothetical protein